MSIVQDVRHAWRGLARTPFFTVGVVLTLALGIGVNAVMFGVLDTLFLKPPAGVTRAGELVRVYFRQTFPVMGTFTNTSTSYTAFNALRDQVPELRRSAAMFATTTGMGRGAAAALVHTELVSAQYFPILGVHPLRGRFFTSDDDRVGGNAVTVLSWGFWQRHFGGDSAVIGRTIPLGQRSYTVIGIAPKGFSGVDIDGPDLFVPIAQAADQLMGDGAVDPVEGRGWQWLTIVARVPSDASLAHAATAATLVFRNGNRAVRGVPDSTSQVIFGPIQAARGPTLGSDARVSVWIGGVALIVLLIACANIANLLLARGVNRQRELGVRASLGASRAALVRPLLMESAVLALLGGAGALLLATWGGSVVRAFLIPGLPDETALVDWRVIAVAAIAIGVTTLLISLLPAIQAARTDLTTSLKTGGHGSTAALGLTRRTLLLMQVAMTLALLVGAGWFVRSLRHAENIDLGFDASRLVTARIDFDLPLAQADATWFQLLDRVSRLPGVEGAALTAGEPFGSSRSVQIRAEGRDSIPELSDGGPYKQAVSPDYFTTFGMHIVEGRGITTGDRAGTGDVAVVGGTFARLVWPGASAIGKCLYIGHGAEGCTRVVGVVDDVVRWHLDSRETMMYYIPLAQTRDPLIDELVVRSARPDAMIPALRREFMTFGSLPYVNLQRFTDAIAPQLRSWRLGAAAFAAFGVLALLIAATGIFAVLSYLVSRRTRELGVRSALGAQRGALVFMVVRDALAIAGLGVAIGGAAALALGRAMAALLFHESTTDPIVLGGAALLLIAVAAAAAWIPARRASRVDPMVALRSD